MINLLDEQNTICGICPAGCWVKAQLADGRLVNVRSQEDHPLGNLCLLGQASPEIVYSKDRLRFPLRRVGRKGTYDFERTTWDEAYDLIVANLTATKNRYGPEGTAIYTGRGSFDLALCDVFQPREAAVSSASSLLFPFGSPNTFGVGALCYVSFAMIAPHVTMGGMLINMDSELDEAELIVVWGSNPATDSPPITHTRILEARRRGAEVIVIDPRRTETAIEANGQWVPIRPGTDGALALSMIQVLIEEDLYDERFAADWTVGFSELRQYVQHFRPEAAAEITWVPAETIRSLARKISAARGASPVMYSGLEYSDSGVQSVRATLVLWALAGQLDVPGGRVFRMPQNNFPINKSRLIGNPDIKKAVGRDRFPVYSRYRAESHAIALPEAVLDGRPYPIKSLIILGGSIITAWPQPEVWRQTLAGLDFLVTIDRQLTADAAYADIVLPATTGYENLSYMVYGPLFRIRERLIEPLGEARNDLLIQAELARRLGYGDRFPQTEEALLDYVLQGSGFSVNDVWNAGGFVIKPTSMMQYKKWEKGLLRPDGRAGFNTPSGKFEISSSILAEHGYDPLPVYLEPKEGPGSHKFTGEYPLVFNSGARVKTDFRSQHHGIDRLSTLAPNPLVSINDRDARARGIRHGDEVFVKTSRGQARFHAEVSPRIVQGAIDANMGGGGPAGPRAWQSCNVNELTNLAHFDPISGFPVYKALLAEVGPVESPATASVVEAFSDRLDEARRDAESVVVESTAVDGDQKNLVSEIYLDYNATAPLIPEVFEAMEPFWRALHGNPSSIHGHGASAKAAVDAARRALAQTLNCTARRLVFTGGGSEADNLAVKGVALAADRGRHIITSEIEHPAVLNACKSLVELGFNITYLPVDSTGQVNPADLESALRPDTILVTVMTANNETGTIQTIAELAAVSKGHGAVFHTDAVQALGKIPLDVEDLGVDLLSVSAHKIGGPKGVGALFVREGTTIKPLVSGGGQENGLRAGTENVAGIVGFAKAAELAARRLPGMAGIAGLRDRLEREIKGLVTNSRLNGHPTERLPNTLNMCLPGWRGESLVLGLDRHGIALSSGSACKSGSPDPSHALLAMGLSAEDAHCSIRLSLGCETRPDEIESVVSALAKLFSESKQSVSFMPCR